MMLFETLIQGKLLFCFIYFGILCGILLSIKNLLDKTFKNKKLVIILTDLFFVLLSTLIFVYAKIKYNYGEFRIYQVLGFALGIVLQQISLNKLVEKVLIVCYNFTIKIFCKLKQTKIFSKILK